MGGHLAMFFLAQGVGQTIVAQDGGRGTLPAVQPGNQIGRRLLAVGDLLLAVGASIEVLSGRGTQWFSIEGERL